MHIVTLLNDYGGAKTSHLTCALWYNNEASLMDECGEANRWLKARKLLIYLRK